MRLENMKTELYYYDVYPKVIVENKEVEITIRPLGLQCAFPKDGVLLQVCPLHERSYPLCDIPSAITEYNITPCEDGCLRFKHTFHGEQEHYLRIYYGGKRRAQLSVYSVLEDLAGLIPLKGDQHLHTIRSDGREDPAIVAAHLRRLGYDYIAITDHNNFAGSLEAIDAYKDAPIEMHLMTGEEVHMPDCPIHIVHMGGHYSVNAIAQSNYDCIDQRTPGMTERFPSAWKAGENSDFPGTVSDEKFHELVEDYAKTLSPIPDDLPKFTYASFAWVCDQIRKAGGLAIFAHPYWIYDIYHVDERLTWYIFQQQKFDAFEVLGGEHYFEQNGFQTLHYDEARAHGMNFPIVGSSDSHSSVNNRNSDVTWTITFAKENTTPSILEAIRARHTVAVDGISKELRVVGEYRLCKYAWFLTENYFPLHDDLCIEQGIAMKEYYCGDREKGLRMLEFLNGQIKEFWAKYLSF